MLKGLTEMPLKQYTDSVLAIFTRVSDISKEELADKAKEFVLFPFNVPEYQTNIGGLLKTELTAQFKENN